MGTGQISAGITANKGSLNLQKCTHIGFSKTNSANAYITDSGAGATAWSIGQKTYNGAIGVDINGKPQETILETCKKKGLATGLVATCAITHATPASFIAHQPSRIMEEDIATDFLKTDIDVFIGGGKLFFTKRKDEKDLLDELRKKEYTVANSIAEVNSTHSGKLAAFLADLHLPRFLEGRGNQLLASTLAALRILNQNKKGFFMMVEGSQIDWGGHNNDLQYLVSELLDFDQVVGEVLRFAEEDGETLVIVTADHETGGFTLIGEDAETGQVEGRFSTLDHTGVMVPVFAYGPCAELFMGIYDNHTIHHKIMSAFRYK
jgi:alkaline phosphatase